MIRGVVTFIIRNCGVRFTFGLIPKTIDHENIILTVT